MSDTINHPERLDLREQIVRIARAIAETQAFQAEAATFRRERFLGPILGLAAALGAIAAVTPCFLRAVSGH